MLIEDGRIREEHLRDELITRTELEEAAHKQSFASLDDVDRAVLEPGGALTFSSKKPAPDETRHRELVERLDALVQQIAQLRPRSA